MANCFWCTRFTVMEDHPSPGCPCPAGSCPAPAPLPPSLLCSLRSVRPSVLVDLPGAVSACGGVPRKAPPAISPCLGLWDSGLASVTPWRHDLHNLPQRSPGPACLSPKTRHDSRVSSFNTPLPWMQRRRLLPTLRPAEHARVPAASWPTEGGRTPACRSVGSARLALPTPVCPSRPPATLHAPLLPFLPPPLLPASGPC